MTSEPLTHHPIIESVFQPIYGLPCWGMLYGWGTSLHIEFGEPWLDVREPRSSDSPSEFIRKKLARRSVYVKGEWTLWIEYCEWVVRTDGKRIGHSNLKGSSKQPIGRAARELEGQKIVDVTLNVETRRCRFDFDLGSHLETWPYNDSDQWALFEPSGDVFTLGAKGHYSHQPGDTRPKDKVWLPL